MQLCDPSEVARLQKGVPKESCDQGESFDYATPLRNGLFSQSIYGLQNRAMQGSKLIFKIS